MVGKCRAWYVIFAVAVALTFFICLLLKYWSPSDLGAEVYAGTHTVNPEPQPTLRTSRQPYPVQHSRLTRLNSKGRIRADNSRPLAQNSRDEMALKRDTHVQPRRMPINFTAHKNDAFQPLSLLNQHKVDLKSKKDNQEDDTLKPKLSLCNPGKVTNAIALGFQPLSQSVVEKVEKFVLFAGYQRSGHSIIGSVLDAHPDIVMAHEYFLFSVCVSQLRNASRLFDNKTQLFNQLYRNSYLSSKCGWRSARNTSKGYNLDVGGQWQGTFRQLRVIGDKSGATTTLEMKSDAGKECLDQMIDSLNMSIIAFHVVRNPYDMIATNILYQISTTHGTKASDQLHRRQRPDHSLLKFNTKRLFSQALAVTTLRKKITVVDVCIEDYIKDPRTSVLEICSALEVPCPQDYVEECYQKAYRNVSRSRDLIEWEPGIVQDIEERMKEFPFFHGYTFEDDFRL